MRRGWQVTGAPFSHLPSSPECNVPLQTIGVLLNIYCVEHQVVSHDLAGPLLLSAVDNYNLLRSQIRALFSIYRLGSGYN